MVFEIPDVPLPTLDRLNASIPPDLDTKKVAQDWFSAFSTAASSGDAAAVAALLVPEAFWRDLLTFTWEFRTFSGQATIQKFLVNRLNTAHPTNFRLKDDLLGLQQPFPDLAWVHLIASRPTSNGEWKAHMVFTNMEDLNGFPEKIGPLRNEDFNHGLWQQQRKQESEFLDAPPQVLIIGAGHSGLDIAARLKYLDVSALILEKNPRVGDNWRNRYDALCLHDPVWYDHMPYIPFPATWPVYTPVLKLANWLEQYAESLELNIWTSSHITSVTQDLATSKWNVTVEKDGKERKFVVNHLVFATGLGSGVPNTPKYPGMDTFKGQLLHSSQHKRAEDHIGKKVIVIGACTSAHDISVDYYNNGVDVTMFQRSSTYIMDAKKGWEVNMPIYLEGGPPVEVADRLNASYPNFMAIGISQRKAEIIADLDKEILDGLHTCGFRTNLGKNGTGFGLLAWNMASGYYLDTGGSKLIADGKIKLKNDSQIKTFTETGIKFEDGSELEADVVIFATGIGEARENVRRVCGNDVADKCKPVWGLDKEGEISGVCRDLGVKGLWYITGNLAICRFHSKHAALQIKAMEEGVFGTRYSL